jgi:hypothetical protein
MWTAHSFFNTIELLKKAEHAPPPQSYLSKVERMYEYGAYANDQRCLLIDWLLMDWLLIDWLLIDWLFID